MNNEYLKENIGYVFLCFINLIESSNQEIFSCSVYYNIVENKYRMYRGECTLRNRITRMDIGIYYLPTKGIGNIVKNSTREFIRNTKIEKLLENEF